MQIWKKNYLLTFSLFLLVFSISLFFITSKYFESEFQYEAETAMSDYLSIYSTLSRVHENEQLLDYLCTQYAKNKTYIKAHVEKELLRSTLPADYFQKNNSLSVETLNGTKYMCITNNREDDELEITLLKDVSFLAQKQRERLFTVLSVYFLLSLFIGIMLYITMKQINKPVSNLSHELRTPLTNIQGYAQYLLTAKTTEEDRFFASEYILNESRNMQQIIDKLLIMGNIREGSIQRSKISLQKSFEELKEKHSFIQIQPTDENIYGDKILINTLLENLISNSQRSGGEINLFASNEQIILQNKNDFIEKNILKALNKNTKLPEKEIQEHGQGVHLCHEIAKLHKATLKYESSKTEGTKITISFK